jgi:hypothetical protein
MFVAINSYALATHDGPYADWPLTTRLLCDGSPTGAGVPGYVIEGQYRWREFVLLLTTWDCPFEESCELLLLDAEHRVVARTSLGAPYASVRLHAHWPIDAMSLRLHCEVRDCYTLSIVPPARWWPGGHRLRLTHHATAPRDAQTSASIRALQARLAELEDRPEHE